jgi:hypothetical protein
MNHHGDLERFCSQGHDFDILPESTKKISRKKYEDHDMIERIVYNHYYAIPSKIEKVKGSIRTVNLIWNPGSPEQRNFW